MVLDKIYNKVDDALVYGANKAVQAWNWTTGRTKNDLANFLNVTGNVLQAGGLIIINPVVGAMVTPFCLGSVLIYSKRNSDVAALEENARDSGLKDIQAEVYKNGPCKYFGSLFLGMGSAFMANDVSRMGTNERQGPEHIISDAGAMMFGSSFYVMRADHLPPRKNCLSRGLDKLDEMVANHKLRSELVPSGI